MNEICIHPQNQKLADIKELDESIGIESLSTAVSELEEAVERAQRILGEEEMR